MKSILQVALDGVVGALRNEQTEQGVVFYRTPADASVVSDLMLDWVGAVPSGVSFTLLTDADSVEVDVETAIVDIPGLEQRAPRLDVTHGRSIVASAQCCSPTRIRLNMQTGEFAVAEGSPETLRFDLPDGDVRELTIWLPHNATCTIRDIRVPSSSTAEAGHSGRKRWTHYGSSISHCMEAASPAQTWPALVAARHGIELTNLGLAGECVLDPFMARAIAQRPADLITLKVGINIVNQDSMRERVFVPAVHGFLDTLRAAQPATPIVVITPILCPMVENAPGPTVPLPNGKFGALARPDSLSEGALSLTRIRALLGDIVERRRAAGDAALHIFQGTELFGEADVSHLTDDLHPDNAGYALMAERFSRLLLVDGPVRELLASGAAPGR